MEVQNYDYYEAHAKDVKLEDITSSQKNADILAKLRNNDPGLDYFSIAAHDDAGEFVVREGDHLGWVGYFAGRNEKIATLYIDTDNDPGENINLNDFLRGVGRNRSIQDLHITSDLRESFLSLIPFFRNNDSLRHLTFSFYIDMQCARNIALLLGQQSSWKRLDFEDTELDDEMFVEIVTALRSQPQMEELRLFSNNIVRNGYVALGNSLEGCLNLRKLELTVYDSDMEYEGLLELAEGLKHCPNLTSLNLYGIPMFTDEGSRSLSSLFQSDNCRLERLYLDSMYMNDDEMAVLSTGLACLPSLKWLYLESNSIGDRGLQDLVRGLVNCNLEKLDLSRNTLMDSVSGLRSLGTLVRRTTNIHMLNLSYSSLTDKGLQSFVEGMANCCNLTELNLSDNSAITANGLASLSSLFRAEHCSLCTLCLHDINIGDDGAAVLVNGLIGNKSLTTLKFYNSSITERGWAAFSRLLCDTSSVNNTYLSNHTLERIGGFGRRHSNIEEFLKLNKLQNHAAAICKILDSHPDIDITPMFEFNLMCLPLVVEWLEKAKSYLGKVNESAEVFKNRQLSVVYKFIRGMPLLAVNGYRGQKMKDVQLQLEVKPKKRKLDQTV